KPRDTERPREVLRCRERGTVSSCPPRSGGRQLEWLQLQFSRLVSLLPSRFGVFDSAAKSEPRGAFVRPRTHRFALGAGWEATGMYALHIGIVFPVDWNLTLE